MRDKMDRRVGPPGLPMTPSSLIQRIDVDEAVDQIVQLAFAKKGKRPRSIDCWKVGRFVFQVAGFEVTTRTGPC